MEDLAGSRTTSMSLVVMVSINRGCGHVSNSVALVAVSSGT